MGGGSGFARREWLTLVALTSSRMFVGIVSSMQGPLYPPEAEKKGSSPAQYGLVFGFYHLCIFVSSPMIGKYIDKAGAKFILYTFISLGGLGSLCFGLLDLVDSFTWFMVLSFGAVVAMSLGVSAATTSSYSIGMAVFPGSVATVLSCLEIFLAIGAIIGPTVGSYLFEVGGYITPFGLAGGLLLLEGLYIYCFMPAVDDGIKNKPQALITPILTLTPILLDALSLIALGICNTFLQATLEPHVRQLGLRSVTTGFVFALQPCTFMLTAFLVGRICDKRITCPKIVIITGLVCSVASLLLIGPAPFSPVPTTFWMVCVGMALFGFGYTLILIGAYTDGIRSSVKHGLPDDITTYAVVSGIFLSCFNLGGIVGPSVGGILFDKVGFREGTLFVIAVLTMALVGMTTYKCTETCSGQEAASSVDSSGSVNLVASISPETDAHAHTVDEGSDVHALTPGKETHAHALTADEGSDSQPLVTSSTKSNRYGSVIDGDG